MVFASTSARDTALSAVKSEGMLCYVTGTKRFYVYDGSNWIVIGHSTTAGRVGCVVSDASLTLAAGTQGSASFDTETIDTDGFITAPSTTITIPSGLGGLYMARLRLIYASGSGSISGESAVGGNQGIRFIAGGAAYGVAGLVYSNQLQTAAGLPLRLGAADTVQISLTETGNSASITLTVELELWRMSP